MSDSEKINRVFLALGANVDMPHATRFDFICFALTRLDENENIQVIDYSKVYETLPVGYLDQTNFLNCVLEIKTILSPSDLLQFCKSEIEDKSGRVKTIENGPRTIDVDILLFGDRNVVDDNLQIPHPRLFERAFVLVPLNDIAPEIVGDISGYKLVDTIDGVIETEYDIKQFMNKFVHEDKVKNWA